MIGKIFIDGRLLSDSHTGISRYIYELIKSYERKYGRENILIICNRNYDFLQGYELIITKLKPYNLLHYVLFPFFLRKLGVSVLHSTTYSGLFFRVKGLHNILTIHDVFYRIVPEFFSKNRIINWLAIKYYDVIVAAGIKNADQLIAVSETTRKDVFKYFKKNSIVIAEGVNSFSHYQLSSKKEDFFLYVGNLRKQKNINLLIDVFKDIPDAKLLIVGNYQNVPREWTNYSNIQFAGYKSDKDLAKLYKSCKAFIFPSIYEGFGLPILEALSRGCIVFSSTGGALKEFKNPNIYHFDPYNKDELMQLVKNSDHLIFDMESASGYLKSFSWENLLEEMHCRIQPLINTDFS